MSTFSNLFSKEMKKGQNPFDAATTAYTNTIRKSLGLKEYSPKGGLLGSFMSSKSGGKKMESTVTANSLNSASIRIVAKNSMSLPIIAKEMNIMRQNIQLMVKKQGLSPKNRSDATLTSAGQTSTIPSASKSSKGGFFESAGSTLKSAGGGLLSITSGIVSGLFGVLGAAGSSFLGMFSGLGMSPLMMIAAGYIVSVLYRAIPFRKIGSDFQKIFNDALNGLSNFFGIDLKNVFGASVEKLKEFFGMSEDEGFLDVMAKKLDETFKTSFFTTNLNKASNILLNAAEDTGIFLQNAFSSIMKYVAATAMTTGDMFGALALDVKNYMRLWLDSNRQELYMIIGAILGTTVGSVIPGIGSVVGGFLGATAGSEYAKHMKAERAKVAKTYGSDIEGGLKRTDRSIQLISDLLKFDGNDTKDETLQVDPDAYKSFFAELEKSTGLDHEHYRSLYRQGKLTLKYFKGQLRAHERVKDILQIESLKKTGPNSLQNFDINTTQSKNLESADQMFPQKSYPTRVFPVDNPRMPKGSHEFGAQRNNSLGKYVHTGVDYLGSIGDPIYAMQDGTVQVNKQPKGMGDYIIIRSPNGSSTVYGHISKSLVKTNDKVTYGQQIAEMGDTGNAKGTPQLHFEAYTGNPFQSSIIDPSEFLKGLPARPTMDNPTGNKNSLISDVTQSAEKNFIDPLVKKFDEMIAAFMAKDTNVVVNTSSESIPAEPYSEEQLANYKLSGINF